MMSDMTPERLEQLHRLVNAVGSTHDRLNAGVVTEIMHEMLDHIEELEGVINEYRIGHDLDGNWQDPDGVLYWRDYWKNRALEAEEDARVLRNLRSAVKTAHDRIGENGT